MPARCHFSPKDRRRPKGDRDQGNDRQTGRTGRSLRPVARERPCRSARSRRSARRSTKRSSATGTKRCTFRFRPERCRSPRPAWNDARSLGPRRYVVCQCRLGSVAIVGAPRPHGPACRIDGGRWRREKNRAECKQGEEDIARQVGNEGGPEEHRRDALSAYLDERVAAGYRIETRGVTQAIIAPTGVRSVLGASAAPAPRGARSSRSTTGRGDGLARRAAPLVTAVPRPPRQGTAGRAQAPARAHLRGSRAGTA